MELLDLECEVAVELLLVGLVEVAFVPLAGGAGLEDVVLYRMGIR